MFVHQSVCLFVSPPPPQLRAQPAPANYSHLAECERRRRSARIQKEFICLFQIMIAARAEAHNKRTLISARCCRARARKSVRRRR